MNNATIERCLGLGQGFLSDSENKNKPETKALLSIIEAFPFMLDVADYKFDKKLSNLYLESIALSVLIEKRKREIN